MCICMYTTSDMFQLGGDDMKDIYIYTVPLPYGVKEAVTPCLDGYTVYISDRLDDFQRLEAYKHAVRHIRNNDFDKFDVQEIESEAHGKD